MIRLEHPAPGAHAGVALLLLDRPDKRNALTPDMLRNVGEALGRAPREGARAIVLGGEGATFCAGFDLSLCKTDTQAMADLLTTLSHAVRAVRRCPLPVVCAAHGGAIAGGCALLCACDIVVTDAGAKIGYPVVRLGVSPAVNALLVSASVGGGRSRERMLDPELVSGAEAGRMGLAHEVVDKPEQVRPKALEIATALAAKPPHALSVTKRWLNEIDGTAEDAALEASLRASLALAGGAEERERLAQLWK